MMPGETPKPGENMRITIDRESKTPLYKQIKEQIKENILGGYLPAGARLPSTRALAQQLDISRISVNNAYLELEADGYLSGEIGRGTYVNNVQTKKLGDDDLVNISPPWLSTVFLEDGLKDKERAAELIRRFEATAPLISFASGLPSPEFFPVREFQFALNDVFSSFGSQALQYDYPEGYPLLRKLIAKNFWDMGCSVAPESVLITAGAQQAIVLLCRALVAKGEVVLSENPTYGGAITALRLQGAKIEGVPLEKDGVNTQVLEEKIRRHHPVLLYLMSSFHNPTGIAMSAEKKQEVIRICNKYQLPVIDDNPYELMFYDGEGRPPLKKYDTEDLVISVSSYSKVFLPGIRLGYLILPERFMKTLIPFKQVSDMNTSPLIQRVVYHYLQSANYQKNLQFLRNSCKKRRDVMMESIARCLPKEIQYDKPNGGSYLWIRTDGRIPIQELYYSALSHGVAFAPGSLFYLDGQSHGCFRVNFALNPESDIELGMERLGKAFRSFDHIE